MRLEVVKALDRLVKQEEFTAAIAKLKLDPVNVVFALAHDPAVLAGARQAFEPVIGLQEDLDRHRQSEPEKLPETWRPEPHERRHLITMLSAPVVWFVLSVALGGLLPGFVLSGTALLMLVVTAISAWYGLPLEFWTWLAWRVQELRLIVQIPTHWWDQRQELREEVLVPNLREWLSSQQTPSFDLELRLRDADGLTLPAGKGAVVRTQAVEACGREVNRSMPGAVGLAGTRGAGKSTIIEHAVANELTDPDRGPMLGVLASAPVRYDARDFVLHLHAQVCRSVLDFLADTRHPAGSESRHQWTRLHRKYLFRDRLINTVRAVQLAAARFLMALGFAGLAWGWRPDITALAREAIAFVRRTAAEPTKFLVDFGWQQALAVLALLFAVRATWNLFWAIGWPLVRYPLVALWRKLTAQRLQRREPRYAALRVVAEQHLRTIRFLQTHTSGWSGKMSAPLGSELALNRSLARTEQPWTHPEVVQRLREFLELVVHVLAEPAELSGIIVAIDELDKISDPLEAQGFLNEIKGLFGVPHCLFLVSVSDDALTAFERRGIPARDAFDSAFTTMIHVQPFSLDESRTWLAQRALGIPEPFVWLCHCVSGGLPRDLGRAAIAMHDLQSHHTLLSDVTRALVRQDLDLKIRAFTHTARNTPRTEENETEQLQALIKTLQDATTTDVGRLDRLADDIWSERERVPNSPTAALRAEVACYLLFCQTITEVLHNDLDATELADRFGVDSPASVVTALATARQHMTIDTALAWSLLADFRKHLQSNPDPGL